MAEEARLARKIDDVGDRARYDACVKELLREKIVLAYLLKHCVPEFKDIDLLEIRDKYIEGVPLVSEIGVDPGETDLRPLVEGSAILGMDAEDSTSEDDTIRFDILFWARLPGSDKVIGMIINIEPQNDPTPGYPVVKRLKYYVARLISAQKGTIFQKEDYGEIRKVYSIGIFPKPPKYKQNSITVYSTREECLVGNAREKKENYDIDTVLMLYLGGKDQTEEKVLRFLEVLLSDERQPEEKKRVFEDDFGITMTRQIEKEEERMGGLGLAIEEKGIRKGIAKGRIIGAIENYREDGVPDSEIMEKITRRYSLTNDEAKRYMAEAEQDMALA